MEKKTKTGLLIGCGIFVLIAFLTVIVFAIAVIFFGNDLIEILDF